MDEEWLLRAFKMICLAISDATSDMQKHIEYDYLNM